MLEPRNRAGISALVRVTALTISTLTAILSLALGCSGKPPTPRPEEVPGRDVSGRVSGLGEQSARVCAWRTGAHHRLTRADVDTPAACTRTKHGGDFVLFLEPGLYDVVANTTGHLPAHVPLALRADVPAPILELRSKRGGQAIRGRVIDINRAPVVGVSVRAFAELPNYPEVVVDHGRTDGDGRYELWVADADVTLRLLAPGYARTPATPGDETLLVPESVISGMVLLDDEPVAHARVAHGWSSDPTWGHRNDAVLTDAHGRFRLDGLLPEPKYPVFAHTVELGGTVNVEALGFADVREHVIIEMGGGYRPFFHAQVVTSEGEPVARCSIGIAERDRHFDSVREWMQSDERGLVDAPHYLDSFELLGLDCPGYVAVPPYEISTIGAPWSRIVVAPGLELRGVLVDHRGAPLVDEQVSLVAGQHPTFSSPKAAISDADGRFTITGLAPGSYGLRVRGWPERGMPQVEIADETAGEQIFQMPTGAETVQIELEPDPDDTVELDIRVVDANGSPIADAVVDILDFAAVARTIPSKYRYDPEALDWESTSSLLLTDANGRLTTRVSYPTRACSGLYCMRGKPNYRIAAMRPGLAGSARFDPSSDPGELTIRLSPR